MSVKYKLFQVNIDREDPHYAFLNQDFLIQDKNHSFPPPAEMYDEVYSGTQISIRPDELFNQLNYNHPEDYRARSMTTSDIIEYRLENGVVVDLFCDDFCFEPIDWKSDLKVAKEAEYCPRSDKMRECVKLHYLKDGKPYNLTVFVGRIKKNKYGTTDDGLRVELTPAQLLKVLLTATQGRDEIRGYRELKTLKGWQSHNYHSIPEYIHPDEYVADDLIDYFKTNYKLISETNGYFQIDAPYRKCMNSRWDKEWCYPTFVKYPKGWRFSGVAFKDDTFSQIEFADPYRWFQKIA